MLPSYKPGDHVLTFNWGKMAVGDVVVFSYADSMSLRGAKRRGNLKNRLPHSVRNDVNDVYFIKRIDKFVDPSTPKLAQGKLDKKVYNYVYISGDNKAESSKMDPVKISQIVGKVVLKY